MKDNSRNGKKNEEIYVSNGRRSEQSVRDLKLRTKTIFTALVGLLYAGWVTPQLVKYGEIHTVLLTVLLNGVFVLGFAFWFAMKAKVNTRIRLLIFLLFVLYLFILHQLVAYVNFSFYLMEPFIGDFMIQLNRINVIPFKTVYNTIAAPIFSPVMVMQIAGNLFLLAPFSFSLLALEITKNKRKTVIFLFLLSAGIECAQLLQSYVDSGFLNGKYSGRGTDIDDVILNTAGAIIGIRLYQLFARVHA